MVSPPPLFPGKRCDSRLCHEAAGHDGHTVVPLGLFHMRPLQRWFSRLRIDPVRQRLRKVTIPLSVGPDLTHWGDPQTLARGGACAPSITAMLSSCAERTPPWRFMYADVALLSVRFVAC